MMNRVKRAILAITATVLLAVSMTGCWDNQSLDQRALVLTMGFYPGSQPGTLKVYFSFPTPAGLSQSNPVTGASGNKQQPPFTTVVGEGHSLAQAFTEAQPLGNRDLFLGHAELLLFSSKLSPPMLSRLQKALDRIGSLDKTPFVAATSTPFSKVLSATTIQDQLPGLYFEKLFTCSTCGPEQTSARLWQVSDKILSPGVDMAIPYVRVKSQHPDVSQVALYRGTQFLTALSPNQTKAFALANGLSRKISLYLPDAWGASLSTIGDHESLRTKVVNGTVHASLTLRVHATLESVDTGTASSHQLSAISKRTSEELAKKVAQFLVYTQKEDVDPLGVGRSLDWKEPSAFAKLEPWSKTYPKVDFTIDCIVRLSKIGVIE